VSNTSVAFRHTAVRLHRSRRFTLLRELLTAFAAISLSVTPTSFGLFTPAITDASYTTGAAFTPDGKSVYYAKSQPGYTGLTIFTSHLMGDTWSEPEVAPFSGTFRDTDPAMSPDGDSVVFASARPPGDGLFTYKLWIAYLRGPKAGTTELLPATIDATGSVTHASFARDGTLYFSKTLDGLTRIYYSPRQTDTFGESQAIAFPDDTPTVRDGDAAIAPDQQYLIFASNRPALKSTNALYISFHRQAMWCAPIPLDAPINSGLEFDPTISLDGQTLYFASNRTSLIQPRPTRASAQSFKAELAAYAHGIVRTYSSAIGPWVAAHASDRC
jgi:hypothetical protein